MVALSWRFSRRKARHLLMTWQAGQSVPAQALSVSWRLQVFLPP
jgi:hypothetical protein